MGFLAFLPLLNTAPIDETKLQTYKIGEDDNFRGVLVSDRVISVIKPGESLEFRLLREQEQKEQGERETIARQSSRYARYSTNPQVEVIGTYSNPNQCVPYAQSQGMKTSGYHIAKYYPVTDTPTGYASTYEGYSGHIVVVEADLGDKLQVRDAGYRYGLITRRIISKSIVKGYVI